VPYKTRTHWQFGDKLVHVRFSKVKTDLNGAVLLTDIVDRSTMKEKNACKFKPATQMEIRHNTVG